MLSLKRSALALSFLLLLGALGVGAVRGAPSSANASPLGTRALCEKHSPIVADPRSHDHVGMVRIPSGRLVLGSDRGYAEERGGTLVSVEAFWIDRTEVTNAQFASFVRATGYVTEAETRGGGAVFHVPSAQDLARGPGAWWRYGKGANWRHPDGPGSEAAPFQPVVQLAYADALAYATWLGRRLPTELEWEYAARGGRDDASLHAEPKDPRGRPIANFWQGDFPVVNDREDGFAGRAPVGCFAANPFGLFDMIGNVWEWTSDEYRGAHQPHGTGSPSFRERAPRTGGERVIKGGSYLCASSFCARYRATARHPHEGHMPAAHVGFRTAKSE